MLNPPKCFRHDPHFKFTRYSAGDAGKADWSVITRANIGGSKKWEKTALIFDKWWACFTSWCAPFRNCTCELKLQAMSLALLYLP